MNERETSALQLHIMLLIELIHRCCNTATTTTNVLQQQQQKDHHHIRNTAIWCSNIPCITLQHQHQHQQQQGTTTDYYTKLNTLAALILVTMALQQYNSNNNATSTTEAGTLLQSSSSSSSQAARLVSSRAAAVLGVGRGAQHTAVDATNTTILSSLLSSSVSSGNNISKIKGMEHCLNLLRRICILDPSSSNSNNNPGDTAVITNNNKKKKKMEKKHSSALLMQHRQQQRNTNASAGAFLFGDHHHHHDSSAAAAMADDIMDGIGSMGNADMDCEEEEEEDDIDDDIEVEEEDCIEDNGKYDGHEDDEDDDEDDEDEIMEEVDDNDDDDEDPVVVTVQDDESAMEHIGMEDDDDEDDDDEDYCNPDVHVGGGVAAADEDEDEDTEEPIHFLHVQDDKQQHDNDDDSNQDTIRSNGSINEEEEEQQTQQEDVDTLLPSSNTTTATTAATTTIASAGQPPLSSSSNNNNKIVVDDDDDDDCGGNNTKQANTNNNNNNNNNTSLSLSSTLTAADRKRYYLTACVHILESQYPVIIMVNTNTNTNNAAVTGDVTTSVCNQNQYARMRIKKKQKKQMATMILPLPSIQQLIHSMNIIIRPPPKPLALKLFLRRAPSQEEFFRGSLSKNPILLSSLRHQHQQQNSSSASSIANNDNNEPLMSDLRQHIANDLQMGDSAELLELLVAGKIIDMGLKVRVVQQVLWRRHVLDNSGGGGSGNAGGSASSIANSMGLNMGMSLGMGMNLSMNISSGGGGGASGNNNDANDPNGGYSSDASVTSLPPMVVTYRLAGVDGEATEDVVSELVDGEEKEKMDEEKEFAITRIVAEAGAGRCFGILLRCIEDEVREVLKSIRRDEIMCKKCKSKTGGGGNKGKRRNPSKEAFLSSPACPALVLLKHCCKLKSNRKKMVEARAPTRMLRILLDILGTITSDDSGESGARSSCGGQSTSDCLQGLIEMLASDMSSITDDHDGGGGDATTEDANMCAAEDAEDTSTVQVLLESLTESESTTLTAPLRKIVADLLPFLTYGQKSSSKALAEQFVAHVQFPRLAYTLNGGNSNIVMDTFVQTLLTLPPVVVCNELRAQLLSLGFTSSTAQFIMQDAPRLPPPWSPALNCSTIGAKRKRSKADTEALEEQWRAYYSREPGLLMALRMLIGLCTKHGSTQTALVNCDGFVQLCHWMESTSISAANDAGAVASSSSGETRNELGLVAETLLDALQEGNEYCKSKIKAARKATKDRKKELAKERRNRALVGMNIATLTSGGAAAFDKATESTSPSLNTVITRRSAKVASSTFYTCCATG